MRVRYYGLNHWWSAISRSSERVNESASGGGKTGRGRLGQRSYQHLWQAITLSKTVPSARSPKLFWMSCWRPTKRTGQITLIVWTGIRWVLVRIL